MASDIKFDGDWVLVEGSWTRIRTLDIMLDAPSRRINQTGNRRALVHDFGDRLTINYNGDYPNGVLVSGHTTIQDLYVPNVGRFAGGIVTPSILVGVPMAPTEVSPGGPPTGGGEYGLDLVAAVTEMQTEIAQLKARVAALEGA